MEWCPPEVIVVLDGEFGDRVVTVSGTGAVWIAGSATNRAAVERLRRGETPYGISLFNYEPTLSGAEAFADIVGVINEHHGYHSCNPPYRRLVVYGARLNAAATAALESIEFEPEAATIDGFTAVAARVRRS